MRVFATFLRNRRLSPWDRFLMRAKRLGLIAFLFVPVVLGGAGCAQKYKYLWKFAPQTWDGGVVRLWYNPKGQVLEEKETVSAIRAAMSTWENVCGISFLYMGTTDQAIRDKADDKFVIGWLDGPTYRERFGTSSEAHARIWWSLSSIYDGEISMNSEAWKRERGNRRAEVLQGILTHELGHALGLAHAEVVDSIMYVPYHSAVYQKTLREYDIRAAQELYPLAAKEGRKGRDEGIPDR